MDLFVKSTLINSNPFRNNAMVGFSRRTNHVLIRSFSRAFCDKSFAVHIIKISNILFFILPPILILLFREYAEKVNPCIQLMWCLLIVVGITSSYFHATLSLVGQLLDELSILWALILSFCLFFPRRLFPKFLYNDRKRFSVVVLTLGILGTLLSIVYPQANAFVLLAIGIPSMAFLRQEVRRVRNIRIHSLGMRCMVVWIAAVFCWVNDRLFCDAWSSTFSFVYFHALWHILVCIAAYTACVLLAYLTVSDERPEKKAFLRYWPKNDFELIGIPYVAVKDSQNIL